MRQISFPLIGELHSDSARFDAINSRRIKHKKKHKTRQCVLLTGVLISYQGLIKAMFINEVSSYLWQRRDCVPILFHLKIHRE